MKYFIDTEFIEGFHKPLFGRRRHFIDLISIGIVAEDGREYYAINNEFDIKAAWNKWQKQKCCAIPEMCGAKTMGACQGYKKVYSLREKVLRPMWEQLMYKEYREDVNDMKQEFYKILDGVDEKERLSLFVKNILPYSIEKFDRHSLQCLIKRYGKPEKQIANEICTFIYGTDPDIDYLSPLQQAQIYEINDKSKKPDFYGYYSDYDWVLFCSLFGTMMHLPKGFPRYCRDLKQMLDETIKNIDNEKWANLLDKFDADWKKQNNTGIELLNFQENIFEEKIVLFKSLNGYPQQTNEHNALADARWNFELYKFLQGI